MREKDSSQLSTFAQVNDCKAGRKEGLDGQAVELAVLRAVGMLACTTLCVGMAILKLKSKQRCCAKTFCKSEQFPASHMVQRCTVGSRVRLQNSTFFCLLSSTALFT